MSCQMNIKVRDIFSTVRPVMLHVHSCKCLNEIILDRDCIMIKCGISCQTSKELVFLLGETTTKIRVTESVIPETVRSSNLKYVLFRK